MATAYTLQCIIVTPERALLDVPADFIALPMYDGEVGVLPGRAPLIGRLGYGDLRIRRGDRTEHLYVDGGFVQVRDNVVSVLTSRAQRAAEIRPEAANQALEAATLALKTAVGDEAQEAQRIAQQKARALLRVASLKAEAGTTA